MTSEQHGADGQDALLTAMMNLTRFHREHEKFYASSPREFAVTLQRHARTMQALADQWSTAEPSTRAVLSPYEGAEDLNSPAAVQLDGVLFLEGEGRPAELTPLIRDLRNAAEDQRGIGEWLATAMESSWGMAATLVEIDGLADMLGERHRIIANDWQAATMNTLTARHPRPRRGHPRARRLQSRRAARRPGREPGLGRPALLDRGADLARCRPVQRVRRTRPRERTTVANLPPARGRGPRRSRVVRLTRKAGMPRMGQTPPTIATYDGRAWPSWGMDDGRTAGPADGDPPSPRTQESYVWPLVALVLVILPQVLVPASMREGPPLLVPLIEGSWSLVLLAVAAKPGPGPAGRPPAGADPERRADRRRTPSPRPG